MQRLNIQRILQRRGIGHVSKSTAGLCHFHATSKPPPLSFVFDIDGVLIRGPHVLPTAKRALKYLEGDNPFQKKIPYILLTNGGGIGEHERCDKLGAKLGFPIKPTQFCQAHTILKKFAPKYADKPVLVLGGERDVVKKVARSYGYQKALTTLDVLAWNPSVWPFHRLSEAERAVTESIDFSKTPIAAVFVYHDPRNWALDVQVTCDVLQSGGVIGGPYISSRGRTPPVELVFCNPDLIWRSDFDRPRIGQGAFKVAFQSVYRALTGSEYPHVQYGKPTQATYEFAEELLNLHLHDLYGAPNQFKPYMVGDNPESDIAGANAAKWSSLLVKTGVYEPANGPPAYKPTMIVEDVEEAVRWAVEQELAKTKSH
ncbi:HAD-like domain-containing protein [Crepidotus variabilis]|uniref:HAD-like domain-containing protein n=1 Tax=Crepidotus variabilis TaxID=179855 RepID=A0A9P6EGD2_9AGAR|nr:HAD-like domain-containing protein [Crepidotus variabilis]